MPIRFRPETTKAARFPAAAMMNARAMAAWSDGPPPILRGDEIAHARDRSSAGFQEQAGEFNEHYPLRAKVGGIFDRRGRVSRAITGICWGGTIARGALSMQERLYRDGSSVCVTGRGLRDR
jgi:hypothetical protein